MKCTRMMQWYKVRSLDHRWKWRRSDGRRRAEWYRYSIQYCTLSCLEYTADVLHSTGDRPDGRQSTVFVLDDSDDDFQEKRMPTFLSLSLQFSYWSCLTFSVSAEKSGESVFDLLAADKASPLPTWKTRLIAFTDGAFATIYMTLLTILVLFIDDVRIAILPPEADDAVLVITYISLVSFSVELSKHCCLRLLL